MFNVSGFGVHEVDACSIPGSPKCFVCYPENKIWYKLIDKYILTLFTLASVIEVHDRETPTRIVSLL